MKYKWIVLSNTTIGTLMASLDTNIIIVALPVIASELHTSLLTTLWTALGYWLVTASVFIIDILGLSLLIAFYSSRTSAMDLDFGKLRFLESVIQWIMTNRNLL